MNTHNSSIRKRQFCAIYTRKSHEDGLEQAFNSLDAQRESALAYIHSQQHEGWEAIHTQYDDGGYSGGNLERPALTQLIEDIKQGKVDIVIVYKVDRLSRSLTDFAKLVELFDEHHVSFVSVTQQFNTTHSMGRLTLNILLSFAQFEREVTGERIRDKIAASKKKGLWMGGTPPLGYDIKERALHINPQEAQLVKRIFTLFIQGNSCLDISNTLNKEKITNKRWQTQQGHWRGGGKFTPNQIHRLLNKRIYLGQIHHKGTYYTGNHQAIIDEVLWDKAQHRLNKRSKTLSQTHQSPFALKGKLRTFEGFAMSPSTTKSNNKPIRYYVSQKAINQGYKSCDIKSINAELLESIIKAYTLQALHKSQSAFNENLDNNTCTEQTTHHSNTSKPLPLNISWQQLRPCIETIIISPTQIELTLNNHEIEQLITTQTQDKSQNDTIPLTPLPKATTSTSNGMITLHIPIQIKRHQGKRWILTKAGQPFYFEQSNNTHCQPIQQAIAEAFALKQCLEQSKLSIKDFAKYHNRSDSFIHQRLALISLSPSIIQQAFENTLSPLISMDALYKASQKLSWDDQHQFLNIQ